MGKKKKFNFFVGIWMEFSLVESLWKRSRKDSERERERP